MACVSRAHARQRIFNAGLRSLCSYLAALAARPFAALHGATLSLLVSGFVCAGALYLVNAALLALVIALDTGTSPIAVWRERRLWMLPQTLLLGQAGTALAAAECALGPYAILDFALPLVAVQLAWRQYVSGSARSFMELQTKNGELLELATELAARRTPSPSPTRGRWRR